MYYRFMLLRCIYYLHIVIIAVVAAAASVVFDELVESIFVRLSLFQSYF